MPNYSDGEPADGGVGAAYAATSPSDADRPLGGSQADRRIGRFGTQDVGERSAKIDQFLVEKIKRKIHLRPGCRKFGRLGRAFRAASAEFRDAP